MCHLFQNSAILLEKYGITLTDYPRRLTTRADWDMSRRELTDQYSPGNLLRGN